MNKNTNKYAQRMQELGAHFYRIAVEEPSSLSEEKLSTVESALGYSLPTDYREFLRDFGEYSLNALFTMQDGPDGYTEGGVGLFFGIGGSYDLLSLRQSTLDNCMIAPEILQLTGDEMGSVCLFLDGPHKGQVYLWYRDQARAPYNYANLYFIASSFDEFMHLLYPIED